jgi:hypothetical protein
MGKRDAEETYELRCQVLKLFSQMICQNRFNLKIQSFPFAAFPDAKFRILLPCTTK